MSKVRSNDSLGSILVLFFILLFWVLAIDADIKGYQLVTAFSSFFLAAIAFQAKNDWLNAERYKANRQLMCIIIDTQTELNSLKIKTLSALRSTRHLTNITSTNMKVKYIESISQRIEEKTSQLNSFQDELTALLEKYTTGFKRESVKIGTNYASNIHRRLRNLDEYFFVQTGLYTDMDLSLKISLNYQFLAQHYYQIQFQISKDSDESKLDDETINEITIQFNDKKREIDEIIKLTEASFNKAEKACDEFLAELESNNL